MYIAYLQVVTPWSQTIINPSQLLIYIHRLDDLVTKLVKTLNLVADLSVVTKDCVTRLIYLVTIVTKLVTTLSHLVNPGVPRRNPAHPGGQARERVEVSRKEDGSAVRGEPATGRHRPQRRGARLLRDGPSEYSNTSWLARFP